MHSLTADPEERQNLADDNPDTRGQLQTILDQQRDAKRLVPRQNPTG
jgi:hypothetical protein